MRAVKGFVLGHGLEKGGKSIFLKIGHMDNSGVEVA